MSSKYFSNVILLTYLSKKLGNNFLANEEFVFFDEYMSKKR